MIQKIRSVIELRESILLLEMKRENEKEGLKEQVRTTYENLRPINLIKNTLNELVSTVPDQKTNLVNTTLSLAAGYLSKKAVVGKTHKPIRQLLGTLLQIGVSSLVAKNPETIKSLAHSVSNFFKKRS